MHIKSLTYGKHSDRVAVSVWDLPEEDPETGCKYKVKVAGRGQEMPKARWLPPWASGP